MNINKELEFLNEKFKKRMSYRGISVFKIIGYYTEEINLYMVFIYFKTESELKSFSKFELDTLKGFYLEFLKEENIMTCYVEKLMIYFDSDENVQKNFNGNYYLAAL